MKKKVNLTRRRLYHTREPSSVLAPIKFAAVDDDALMTWINVNLGWEVEIVIRQWLYRGLRSILSTTLPQYLHHDQRAVQSSLLLQMYCLQ